MTSEYVGYLAHYGVKGQKWGVRRYQNKDGTLIKTSSKKNKPESKQWKNREASHLSNEELDRRNTRLQKENQYRLNVENAHPAKKEIKQIAKKVILYSSVGVMSGIMATKYKAGAEFVGNRLGQTIHTIIDNAKNRG